MRIIFTYLVLLSSLTVFSQKKSKGNWYVDRAFDVSENQPDSAVYYAEKAIQLGLNAKDSLLVGSGYAELGTALRIKGDHYNSLEALQLALRFLPKTTAGKSKRATTYSALGNLYYITGQTDKAKDSYWKSFRMKRETKRFPESAIVATQLASIYSIDSTSDSVFFFAEYALKYLNAKDHPNYVANLYNSLGSRYSFSEETFDSSLYYYNESLQLFSSLQHKSQMAVAQCNIAIVYAAQGKLEAAEEMYLLALTNLTPGSDLFYRSVIYNELASIYLKTNQYQKYIEADRMKDSVSMIVYSAENSKNLLELEEKYQSAEKDKEIRENKIQIQNGELALARERERFYNWLFLMLSVLGITGVVFIYIYLKRRNQRQLEIEKERFFSNIVHEIRTPLTLISAPVSQLKTETTDKKTQLKFNLIERNIERLGALVNQLLDLSKIDAKKYKLRFSYGNAEVFLVDIVEKMEQMSLEKNIHLKLLTTNCDQIVQLDFDAVEKILVNLISNAIKYSDNNTTVQVFGSLETHQLKLTIQDQGPGIPGKLQQKIFSRFDRGNNTEPNKGVGIGLSLVKELCQLLKAEIFLTSKVGSGTTFEVLIPVSRLSTDYELSGTPLENSVLVVEDDPDMRIFISSLLTDRGFQVLEAENGLAALALLDDNLPTLILTDAMMPEMDGYTLVSKVKQTELLCHIPVIFLSAKASTDSKLKGLRSGADFYLEKPFNPDQLILTINNTIATIINSQNRFSKQLKSKDLSFEEKISSDDPFIKKLNQLIVAELENAELTVETIAGQMAISRSQLHRKVKSVSGKSISNYIRIIRLEKAIELLRQKEGNVSEIAYSTGFSSQSYFTKCFTDHFGFPPSQIEKNLKV